MHAAISYGITHVVRKLFRYEKDFLSSNEETTLMHLIRCDLEQEENEDYDEMIQHDEYNNEMIKEERKYSDCI